MLSEKSYIPRIEIKMLTEFLEKCIGEAEAKLSIGIQ
jgi:hypothetical protein